MANTGKSSGSVSFGPPKGSVSFGAPPSSSGGKSGGSSKKPKKSSKIKETASRMPKWAPYAATVAGIFLFAGAGVMLFMAAKSHKEELTVQQTWEEVAEAARPGKLSIPDANGSTQLSYTVRPEVTGEFVSTEGYSVDPMYWNIDFESLSPSVACWIYIPGTNVDYPVMQEAVAGTYYYLNHDYNGRVAATGSIFEPLLSEYDSRLFLFGHHMMSEQMFGRLDRYKSVDYYKEHPYIYIYYRDHTEKWEVCSAYNTTVDDVVYTNTIEYGSDVYQSLLTHIKESRFYEAAEIPDSLDDVLLLSTCNRSFAGADGRFILAGSLQDTVWFNDTAKAAHDYKQSQIADYIELRAQLEEQAKLDAEAAEAARKAEEERLANLPLVDYNDPSQFSGVVIHVDGQNITTTNASGK